MSTNRAFGWELVEFDVLLPAVVAAQNDLAGEQELRKHGATTCTTLHLAFDKFGSDLHFRL